MPFCCCVTLAVVKPSGCSNTRMACRNIGNKDINNVYYMEHMKGCHLKRFFPALAWGVSCIFFLLVVLFICYEYDDYRFQCNVGLVEDGIDELHTTLLSVGVGALACLFVIACRLGVDVEEVESPSFESGIHGCRLAAFAYR